MVGQMDKIDLTHLFDTQGILAAIPCNLKRLFINNAAKLRALVVFVHCNFCIKICLIGYFIQKSAFFENKQKCCGSRMFR